MNGSSIDDPSGSPGVSSLLLPTMVDHIAEVEPEAMWIATPLPPVHCKYKYEILTYLQFSNAINSAAWWLEREIGKGDKKQPLAYFGTGGGDIGYPILLIAAVKAGYYVSPTLLPSGSLLATKTLRQSLIPPETAMRHIFISSKVKIATR